LPKDDDDEEGEILAIVVLSFTPSPFFAVVGAGVDDVGSLLASDMAGIYIVR
jgi:hypothetical protein